MDLIGVAPVDRFQDLPKGFHPLDILPEAKSVIVSAKYFPFQIITTCLAAGFVVRYARSKSKTLTQKKVL
jgi:hypothetical protein